LTGGDSLIAAGVELNANRLRQAGDFSDAGHEYDLLFDGFQLFAIPW
jgi:hypothetical protein